MHYQCLVASVTSILYVPYLGYFLSVAVLAFFNAIVTCGAQEGLVSDDTSCVQMADWQLDLVPGVFYSHYPSAVVDVADSAVWVLCPPHEFSARKHNIVSHDLRLLWLSQTDSPSPTHL